MKQLVRVLAFGAALSLAGAGASGQEPANGDVEDAAAEASAGADSAATGEPREKPERVWRPWRGRLYGRSLTTKEERQVYRAELQQLETDEERLAFWREHVDRMQARALERGVSVEDPPRPPSSRKPFRAIKIYGEPLMTPAETAVYRREYEALETPGEREAYVQAHVARIQKRAKNWSIDVQAPDWRGPSDPNPPTASTIEDVVALITAGQVKREEQFIESLRAGAEAASQDEERRPGFEQGLEKLRIHVETMEDRGQRARWRRLVDELELTAQGGGES